MVLVEVHDCSPLEEVLLSTTPEVDLDPSSAAIREVERQSARRVIDPKPPDVGLALMFSKRLGEDRTIGPLNPHQASIEVQLSDRKAHVPRLPRYNVNTGATGSCGIVSAGPDVMTTDEHPG
jgi:hypothetical protein